MTNEREVAFIHSFDKGNSHIMDEIEEEARRDHIPIIRKETEGLLRFLVETHRPEAFLEVGCAVGYSALLFCEWGGERCKVTTIERDEERIRKAKENFQKAGKQAQIRLLEGDAHELLETLEGCFDMIFMDAAKGQYLGFLPKVLGLLKPGGMLISDNCLQDGDVLESRFAVNRRDRTIHARMREYLYTITHHPMLSSCILPVGDGIALSVKTGE